MASGLRCLASYWPAARVSFSQRFGSFCSQIGATNSVIRGCALLMAFTPWNEPALARSYLNCLAKKVVIVDTPSGSTSSNVEEHLGFWIDEAAKTLMQARPRGTVLGRS
jgi:ornithine cyclodeaminase/alanine dehydrogenase-like protein (mu-crystallin family)